MLEGKFSLKSLFLAFNKNLESLLKLLSNSRSKAHFCTQPAHTLPEQTQQIQATDIYKMCLGLV